MRTTWYNTWLRKDICVKLDTMLKSYNNCLRKLGYADHDTNMRIMLAQRELVLEWFSSYQKQYTVGEQADFIKAIALIEIENNLVA